MYVQRERNWRMEIQTSDIRFMKRNFQLIDLLHIIE